MDAQGPESRIISRMFEASSAHPNDTAIGGHQQGTYPRNSERHPQGISVLAKDDFHRALSLDYPVPVRKLFSISYIFPGLVTNPAREPGAAQG